MNQLKTNSDVCNGAQVAALTFLCDTDGATAHADT